MNECTCAAKDMPFGRCCKAPTSSDVIAGLEMALSQAEAIDERQQHVIQRAIEAWDCTTHQKNGDGRLWQCMEELRGESGYFLNQQKEAHHAESGVSANKK